MSFAYNTYIHVFLYFQFLYFLILALLTGLEMSKEDFVCPLKATSCVDKTGSHAHFDPVVGVFRDDGYHLSLTRNPTIEELVQNKRKVHTI